MSNTPKSENEIRDHLANNLGLIEPGLRLVKKEQYLPNSNGAAGFVDLYAQDSEGHLTVIELKKSDAAARQAIQELIKYAALLKTNKLIKDQDLRLIVASTDWHELLVPFSEFVHDSSYSIQGKKLVIGSDGLTEEVEDISPLPPSSTRKFSRRHWIWEFSSEEDAKNAVPLIAKNMEACGLSDFVIAMLQVTPPIDGVTHIAYFAQQELSFDEYYTLIRQNHSAESLEEFDDWVEDLTEESDRVDEAADKVWDITDRNRFKYAGQQLSHPEKARVWLDKSRTELVSMHRGGRFMDENLDDDKILKEIRGETSGSTFHLNTEINLSSKAEISELLEALDEVFFNNSAWKASLDALVGYAQKNNATKLNLQIFNNDDILTTLSYLAIGTPNYCPYFTIDLDFPDRPPEHFIGVIEWNGNRPQLEELLQEHFEDATSEIMWHRHFGSNRGYNDDLMIDLGFSYAVRLVESADKQSTVRIAGASIRETKKQNTKLIFDFCGENPEFLIALADLYQGFDMSYHQQLAHFELHHCENGFLQNIARETYRDPVIWCGDLKRCDLCQRSFNDCKIMIDGWVEQGAAACVCAVCFSRFGRGIGWGSGQLYEKTEKGWELIAGGCPDETHE